MLYRYELYRNKNVMYLRQEQQIETEDIPSDTNDIFEIMEILNYNLGMCDFEEEHLYLMALDNESKLLGIFLASIGTEEACYVDFRSMVCFLILINASKAILVHNHPNQVLMPSEPDYESTFDCEYIFQKIGVEFVGDYVITHDGYINTFDNEKIYFTERKR